MTSQAQNFPILTRRSFIAGSFAAFAFAASPAAALQCGDGPNGFDAWLAEFRRRAEQAGFSPDVLDAAFADVSYDPEVISRDRKIYGFGQDFASFAAKRVTPRRIKKGREMLIAYGEPLEQIEARFGVPGAVVVAIWGLESEFGAGTGDAPTFTVLTTLAYDCRRPERFLPELIAALKLLQRGSLQASDFKGAWAGEIGQTQLMPSTYLKWAVAYDGHSVPDLIHRSTDALASTANYLSGHGWKRGEGWDENEPNYEVLLAWNAAPVYAKTIGLFADRLEER
jgi:lytic murein transglycosylase